jgi:hypothetical protein
MTISVAAQRPDSLSKPMISLENFQYRYQPFPIGVAQPFIDPDLYLDLAASFPSPEQFPLFRTDSTGQHRKLSLSARSHPRALARFLAVHPSWRALYRYLYSTEFVESVLVHLEDRGIRVTKRRSRGLARWINLLAPTLSEGRTPRLEKLVYTLPRKLGGISSKVEFSAIPGRDGGLMPHTDAPGKLVTLVVAFPNPGEWEPDYGGATSIVEPKDERQYFNRLNDTLPFDDVTVLRTVEHQPNQAMLFVKTFNSWHAVMPTTGPADRWRKTLTINIMTG